MFKKYIEVPLGVQAVVDGKLRTEKRFRVSKKSSVHYVDFTPHPIAISVDATCMEGAPIKFSCKVETEIPRGNLEKDSLDWGWGDRDRIPTITAKVIADRVKLEESLKNCVITFLQASSFWKLKKEDIRDGLQQKVQELCERRKLAGELFSCEVAIPVPDSSRLGALSAAADGQAIADYFIEVCRKTALIDAEKARAAYEGDLEKARDKDGNIIAEAKLIAATNLKIKAIQEDDRVAVEADILKVQAALREAAAQERNKNLLISSANFDKEVRMAGLKNDMEVADEQAKLEEKRNASRDLEREQKRLNMETLEGLAARMRMDELAARIAALRDLIGGLKEVPTPDYSGIRTLVGGAEDSRSLMVGVVARSLEKLLGGDSSPDQS